MTAAALAGSTGLVGSHILTTLLAHPSTTTISAFTRRDLPANPKLHPLTATDTSTWPATFGTLTPTPPLFLSALGTTRAQAGSIAAQRAIDYDLNLALAQAAREAGVRVYVLISSAGVSASSALPYSKMKGELEAAVAKLGFDKCVVLKPGLICGERQDSRPAEAVTRAIAAGLGKVSGGLLKDFWAQDAVVIARAAVRAGMLALEGKAPEGEGLWVVGMADIVRLGRTEWKE